MVNSGSSANLLMVASLRYISNPSLKLNKGDTIIVPAFLEHVLFSNISVRFETES